MAKKKKIQKIKRDADKLLRTGRYWEWLQAIEAGKLERQYPRERDQVWNTLIRKALRLARDFEEFCANVENIKDPPNRADFRLLMAL